MAKTTTARCIDSSGIERQYKQAWLNVQCARGRCSLGADGVYRFLLHSQDNGGASQDAPQGQAARMTFRITLRPNEPTPDHVSFLSYPQARRGSSHSLRALYPTLAREGAGLR
jgi:hypothetical protein